MVDNLSHEVSEEDSLSNDGEPGKQMTGTQSQQLWGHLQHGEPQQPHSGLNLRRGDKIRQHPTKKKGDWIEIKIVNSYFSLLALCISTGGVGVSAAVSVSLSAPPPVSGLHFVQVVHAARRLDEKGGVGPAVPVAVASNSTVVGECTGRLAVEGVMVA